MNTARNILEVIGSSLTLLLRAIGCLPRLPRQLGRVFEYSFQIGYLTLPIVAVLSFFLGAVLALQTGYSLDFGGGQELIGRVVGLAMARELAPLITAFLLAGRVGSAITAELASMTVYQEIDAQRTMQVPPERIHVMPRLVAILFMMPVLTIVAILIGWFGGAVVSEHVSFIGLDPTAYWANLKSVTEFKDVLNGLIKAEVFGLVIVLIACNQGLITRGGPREIGHSVTNSVVSSMFMVLLIDYCLTRILM
ncbi:MlaE family ABC transporter permease [Cerasicoccus arenae]|uniref:MlaE family ABC transporter permease n=1 Tax=Cerasicoccus arenae TaxID=424488 RepID=UPI001676BFB9|nr:ABC transporter permease [Cerasicoccus arenae]MBK1859449.1 ABC transporter permease [Cerasicoccus arenae]